MPDVTFTVDGKTDPHRPRGHASHRSLQIRRHGDPRLLLLPRPLAAGRLPHVRRPHRERCPSSQTACTTTVAEGMVVISTETPRLPRRASPLCSSCSATTRSTARCAMQGGQCELQDMTFKYGAADSFYAEPKNHREEQKWSPVVYFDRPRCILCYRCIRMCGEGMDVFALGIQNRGSAPRSLRPTSPPPSSRLEQVLKTRPSLTASSAACASTPAPWARSPPAPTATRPAPGR